MSFESQQLNLQKDPENPRLSTKAPTLKEVGAQLGKGDYGKVDQATVAFESRSINLARKKFDSEESARESLKKYQTLKSKGMKVLPTYRINKSQPNEIYMTNLSKEGEFIISNNSEDETLNQIRIEEIINLDELTKTLAEQCKIATKNNVSLSSDCFFFVASPQEKENSFNIDFFIADLDEIGENEKEFNKKKEELLENNISEIEWALEQLLRVIKGPLREELNKKLQRKFDGLRRIVLSF